MQFVRKRANEGKFQEEIERIKLVRNWYLVVWKEVSLQEWLELCRQLLN